MRAWLFTLGLPLVVACGGSVGVDGGKPTQASIEASLPGWCQSTCEKLMACDAARGNDTESVSDCSHNCRVELTDGVQRSPACAQRIDEFKSCVDAKGCAAAYDDVCSLHDAGECDDDEGDTVSPGAGPSPPGAGGSPAGPPPSPPPMVGIAGGSSTGPIPFDPPVYCSSGSGTGGSAGPARGGVQLICETSYGDCSNGSSYDVTCVSTTEGQSSCSCFVDNGLWHAFDPGGVCPSLMQLNSGCGWNIQ